MKGGHARSGPVAASAAARRRQGAEVRARHREKGSVGPSARAEDVAAPPYLTEVERELWDYYAALLAAEGRLTAKARDVLAKYCEILALWRSIKKEMNGDTYRHIIITTSVDSAGTEHLNAKPNPLLIQFHKIAQLARGYEADLILCPAVAVRLPSTAPDAPEDDDEFGLGSASGPTGVVRGGKR